MAEEANKDLIGDVQSFIADAKAGKDPSIEGVKLSQAESYLTQASAALQMASTNAALKSAGLDDEAKAAASFLSTVESGLEKAFGKQSAPASAPAASSTPAPAK